MALKLGHTSQSRKHTQYNTPAIQTAPREKFIKRTQHKGLIIRIKYVIHEAEI